MFHLFPYPFRENELHEIDSKNPLAYRKSTGDTSGRENFRHEMQVFSNHVLGIVNPNIIVFCVLFAFFITGYNLKYDSFIFHDTNTVLLHDFTICFLVTIV